MADPGSGLGMQTPYAPRVMLGAWVAGGWAGIAYGVYLTVIAVRSPPGTELTGHWILQPPFKALMALLFGFPGLMCAVPLLAATLVAVKMLYVENVVGDQQIGQGQDPARGVQ